MNGTITTITLKHCELSYVLRPLEKATKYVVHLRAFTNAGEGIEASYSASTDEDGKLAWGDKAGYRQQGNNI